MDNDCDGAVDESEATDAPTWYSDDDGDGFGDPGQAATACEPPAGHVEDAGDCDDGDPDVHPDAAELCDGVDNDCDGVVDDDDAEDAAIWYADGDGDGYGDVSTTADACMQPVGYVATSGDCDDGDASVHPGASEVAGDGIDQDCDGEDLSLEEPPLEEGCACAAEGRPGGLGPGLLLFGLLGLVVRRRQGYPAL